MANHNKTEEEKLIEFNDKMKVLLGQYGYALAAIPFIDSEGAIKAKPTVFKAEELKKKEGSVLEQS